MNIGVENQAVCFLNRFLPGEVYSGISVLIADGRCFFLASSVNLL